MWYIWGSLGSFVKPAHGVLCAPRNLWSSKPESLITTFKILRKSEENLCLESQLAEPSLFVERFCEILVAEESDHCFHFLMHLHLYAQMKQIAHSVYLHTVLASWSVLFSSVLKACKACYLISRTCLPREGSFTLLLLGGSAKFKSDYKK